MPRLSIWGPLCALVSTASVFAAQVNFIASSSNHGEFGDTESAVSRVSADGRYVVFESRASNLVDDDLNGFRDIFRRDLQLGRTVLVSQAFDGSGSASGISLDADISGDGRYVVWATSAANIVPGDTNNQRDVFLRDMQTGLVERLSVTSSGAQVDGANSAPRISADGRWVVFWSQSGLVPSDLNGFHDVYRLDRQTGELALVSVTAGGLQGNFWSYDGDISDDGRYVTFSSEATNLAAGDNNFGPDIFLKDMGTDELRRISENASGSAGNGLSESPCISGDGSTVSYTSHAEDLVPGDTNGFPDAFAYDVASAETERLSVRPDGGQSLLGTALTTSMSFEGRFVAFSSLSSDLVPGDTNGQTDIFLRDRTLQTTELISLSSGGAQLNNNCWRPHLTPDGRLVTFTSDATNVLFGDTLGARQVYARDLSDNIGTSYCNVSQNSTGMQGEITATGSTLFVDNDLTLTATSLTPDAFGYFIVSTMQGFIVNPGGQRGTLCLSSPIGRYRGPGQVQNSGPLGSIELSVDLAAIPQPSGLLIAFPGASLHFQAWHRDEVSGQPTSSFSRGVSVRVN